MFNLANFFEKAEIGALRIINRTVYDNKVIIRDESKLFNKNGHLKRQAALKNSNFRFKTFEVYYTNRTGEEEVLINLKNLFSMAMSTWQMRHVLKGKWNTLGAGIIVYLIF